MTIYRVFFLPWCATGIPWKQFQLSRGFRCQSNLPFCVDKEKETPAETPYHGPYGGQQLSRQHKITRGKNKKPTAKQNCSRQNQIALGKTKLLLAKQKRLTAKPKRLTAKPNFPWQNKKTHGKKQKATHCQLHSKRKRPCFISSQQGQLVFRTNAFFFCRESFWFCREQFCFAVGFSFLPRVILCCRDNWGPQASHSIKRTPE